MSSDGSLATRKAGIYGQELLEGEGGVAGRCRRDHYYPRMYGEVILSAMKADRRIVLVYLTKQREWQAEQILWS